jgi:hypothetical protein
MKGLKMAKPFEGSINVDIRGLGAGLVSVRAAEGT